MVRVVGKDGVMYIVTGRVTMTRKIVSPDPRIRSVDPADGSTLLKTLYSAVLYPAVTYDLTLDPR